MTDKIEQELPQVMEEARRRVHMADKGIEQQLAEGMEEDLGIKAMAAKLAPRVSSNFDPMQSQPRLSTSSSSTVEQKLQQIERLVGEIRQMSAQVKGMLG